MNCPYCGSKDLYLNVMEWIAVLPQHPEDSEVVPEHHCLKCDAVFWCIPSCSNCGMYVSGRSCEKCQL